MKSQIDPRLRPLFEPGFLWGASIAAHQVEGGTYNQWTRWELDNASELAKSAEKRFGSMPGWEMFKAEALKPDNYVSGRGTGHFRHYKDDFELAKKLGLNAMRVGLEWSRIEPEEGVFDPQAIRHYQQYLECLKTMGLTPILTLWHWTHPIWFEKKGAFTKRANVFYFQRFIEKLCDELKIADLPFIVTINEPNVYAGFSYIIGARPPQQRNLLKATRVYFNLVTAHKRAYTTIKAFNPNCQIGLAAHLIDMKPKQNKWLDKTMARLSAYAVNWWFLRRVRRQQDYVGINFYLTNHWSGFKISDPKLPVSDIGWYMDPSGIGSVIKESYRRFKKPILILENGVCDANDQYRGWWLAETISELGRARAHKIPIIGYCHWSLLDNFEWDMGWFPKFGLITVNRETSRRSYRPSAVMWAKWLQLQD